MHGLVVVCQDEEKEFATKAPRMACMKLLAAALAARRDGRPVGAQSRVIRLYSATPRVLRRTIAPGYCSPGR